MSGGGRIVGRIVAGLAVATTALFALPPPAQAALSPLASRAEAIGMSCSNVTSSDGMTYTKCTGEIPSFDGIGIETDLSLPLSASAALPTVLMLHGWGGDKTDWETDSKAGDGADQWHWNNVWFVSRGYAVVNTTARGFGESCGMADADPNCATGWTHLSSREWETRDSQTVLGTLVDAHITNPTKMASTGASYGGGQSWLLATSMPWTSPAGHAGLQLAVAIPKYPWTDLLDSLLPNGRGTDAVDQSASHERPFGVEKLSYVSALYALGKSVGGRYNTADLAQIDSALDAQYALVNAGEPYDTNPITQELAKDEEIRSAYYAKTYLSAVAARTVKEVPVLSIQGWTDALFPAVETLQMFRKVKAADPAYPVKMIFGDIGHPNAVNPPAQWHPINTLANGFLDHYLKGTATLPGSQAYAYVTACPPAATPTVYAGAWSGLAPGVAIGTGGSKSTAWAQGEAPEGADADPLVNMGHCITEQPGISDPAAAAWSWKVPSTGLTMLGLPTVRVTYALSGVDAEAAYKLWDVAPDGSKTLVTRGLWRFSVAGGDPASRTIRVKLFGNAWHFAAGHAILLQIAQSDAPYLRPDNLPSEISWSALQLSIPTREPGTTTLPAA